MPLKLLYHLLVLRLVKLDLFLNIRLVPLSFRKLLLQLLKFCSQLWVPDKNWMLYQRFHKLFSNLTCLYQSILHWINFFGNLWIYELSRMVWSFGYSTGVVLYCPSTVLIVALKIFRVEIGIFSIVLLFIFCQFLRLFYNFKTFQYLHSFVFSINYSV